MYVFSWRFRRAVTSAVWCLHCSMWCGPRCFWNGGRGGGLSWRTSGEHWMRLPNPWRNHVLSSGWEILKLWFLHPPLLSSFRPFHAFVSRQGVKRCSPITGCEEFYYPPWRRRVFRWLVSLPICILCLCFVFLVMLICFELQVSQLSASVFMSPACMNIAEIV